VRDAALMLNTIAGPDPRDAVSLDLPARDWVGVCDSAKLDGLRVAWSPDFGYAAVDPEVRRVTSAAVAVFAELGCVVEEVNPDWDDPEPWAELLWDFTTASRNLDRARQRPDWIEPTLLAQIDHGVRATSMEIGQAQVARTAFYEQARQFMERFDLLVTPQMPCVAWPVDVPPREIGGRPTPRMFDRLSFTFPFNLTGWPAATLPCGFNSEGLPIALQVVTGWHQDALCMQAAAAFESRRPWSAHRPPPQ
jgi:aspartyl-tRNA(Asn)/glutamyl-tRNA(Gln) amidotransferase subunit A